MADRMFTFSFSPEMREFEIAFGKWADEIKDWRRAWTDVRRLFQSHEKKHFDSEGATTGEPFVALNGRPSRWTQNKPYADWKAEHYPGLPIMQREGVLFRALVEGGQGSLFRRNRKSMEVGIKKGARISSKVPGMKGERTYNLHKMASAHQTGSNRLYGGGVLPKRPPVRFGRDVTQRDSFAYALSQVMQAHIVLARRRALRPEIEAAFDKAHADSEVGAKKTINSMINGTWK